MIKERDTFEVREIVKRGLAAQDRVNGVRESYYDGYLGFDWQAALLADLMLVAMQFSGDREHGFEMDLVRAELVAGVRVEGGRLGPLRKMFGVKKRRLLRDKQEQPFFDYGRWA